MNNTNTGGPAFPHLRRYASNDTYEPLAEGGMTLRDYFATKAMQGIISTNTSFLHNPEQLAAKAFEFADAMLKAREQ
jgi:hypothetical protein